jgi:hypothetical protein
MFEVESLKTKPIGIGAISEENPSIRQPIMLGSFCLKCDTSDNNPSKTYGGRGHSLSFAVVLAGPTMYHINLPPPSFLLHSD